MRIARLESLHADAGTCDFDFLELTTDPCESLFGRRDYRPYFENSPGDVAIIDTPWNGVGESVRIATMMSARSCAVVPNLRVMETDPDTVPWRDDLVTVQPVIKDGYLTLPSGPGWGTEVNDSTVRAHPPRQG